MKQCDITDTLEVDPMIVNSIEELFQKMRMNSDIRMLWRLMMQEYHLVIGKKYVLISIVVYFSSDLIIIISLYWSVSLQTKISMISHIQKRIFLINNLVINGFSCH
jgi:hypothetical protein